MAFPEDRLEPRIEAALGANILDNQDSWLWSDITEDADRLMDQTITIYRGRPDESSQAQPSTATLRLDNTDGKYTPHHPESSVYQRWGRGTPIRISMEGDGSLVTSKTISPSGAATPDSPALSITGDMFVAFEMPEVELASGMVTSKYDSVTDNRSWVVMLNSNGRLWTRWSEDGVTYIEHFWYIPPEWLFGPLAVGWYLNVDDGAGGHGNHIYLARSLDDEWTHFRSVVESGTTSVFDSTAQVGIGNTLGAPALPDPAPQRISRMVLRSGDMNGTVVASPDFRPLASTTTSFEDAQGNMWSLVDAEIDTRNVRFIGQVSEIAPEWPAGDISTSIDPGIADVVLRPSGILRRLRQGAKGLQSPIRRFILANAAPVEEPFDEGIRQLIAYWPCEDSPGATVLAAATPNTTPISLSGKIEPGLDATLPSSDPLPTITDASSGMWIATVPSFSTTAPWGWTVSMVVRVTNLPGGFDSIGVIHVATTGALKTISVTFSQDGVSAFGVNAFGGLHALSGTISGDLTEGWMHLEIQAWDLNENGAVEYTVAMRGIGSNTFPYGSKTDVVTGAIGRPTQIRHYKPPLVTTDSLSFGHVKVVTGSWSTSLEYEESQAEAGYVGERAIERVARLAAEEGLDIAIAGGTPFPPSWPNYADSTPMGPQRSGTIGSLLDECAEADMAVLAEHRNRSGLFFRSMSTRFNSPPFLRLDAAVNEIAPPFGPVDDDQRLRNDVTVNRPEGASAIRTDEASIQAEGQYSYGVEVNAANDEILPDLAGIRLYFGTWAGMRYPTLSVDLLEAPHLARKVTSIREGDRIEVTGLPEQHPSGNILLVVEAIREDIGPRIWKFTFTCSAGGPWDVQRVGTGRVGATRTQLAAAITDTDISMTVDTDDTWVNSADHFDEFPFLIEMEGEIMEVTAISGEWVVTRAVNGVAKAHDEGAVINLVDGLVIVP